MIDRIFSPIDYWAASRSGRANEWRGQDTSYARRAKVWTEGQIVLTIALGASPKGILTALLVGAGDAKTWDFMAEDDT